ncbi:hypothetical protein B0T22DRAFT_204445 [Podospora appendiculata]|uniref:DUF1996 domain-containing protein n=1 Tax=Podospora appendiculata TaxID=314037 RepID=A0AAE0X4R2_9PEZI|nr:hypothetical protein B0T22DRAFT_204445 [Podospora appendiculata]
MKLNVPLAVLTAASGVTAFWRMECRGRAGLLRIDPLVSPGEVGAHAHAVHGSSGFNEKATYDDLINGNCTSCAVTQDKSAYWAPGVYFRHSNGSYELVDQVGGMLAYYFLNKDANNPNGKITAFPKDFRMIAGDSLRRNYTIAGQGATQKDPEKSLWAALGQTTQTDLSQRAIGYNCLNYDIAPEPSLYRHYLPEKGYLDANCKDGIRIEIMFPSCWNGKDLDSTNHKDHVAYPDLVEDGGCPQGFDVKLPGLFYETIWATNDYKGVDGEFVIANGDVQGFGYHADFIMGWDDEAFLQSAVNTCTNLSGEIQDCPLFNIQSEDEQRSCKINVPSALSQEKVVGLIGDSLPGNVAIQYGPSPATAKNPGPQTATVPVPTVSYSKGVSSSGYPGLVFKETTTPSLIPSSTPSVSSPQATDFAAAAAAPATTPAPTASTEDGKYEVIRTEYVTSGNVVNEIIVKEAVEYVTVTTTTVTVSVPAKRAARREAAHAHRHVARGHGRPRV